MNDINKHVEKYKQHYVGAGVTAASIWWLLFSYGERIPFMRNEFLFEVRMFGVFPIVLLFSVWFIFFYRWAVSGTSGFQMAMAKESAGSITRIFKGMLGVFCCAFFAGIFAWSCILIPTWCSHLFASTQMRGIYQVIAVKSVSNFREARLLAEAGGAELTLPLADEKLRRLQLRKGDVVCIHGRSSFFGAIAETATLDAGDCRQRSAL